MDNDIFKLQQAKMYMDYLSNGIDPVSNTDADADTLHNEQIITCFRYISDVLTEKIYEAGKDTKRRNKNFYITEKQYAELTVYPYNCKVSELANEINRVTEINGTKKLSPTWINDWLESEGHICKSDLRSRIATDKGKQLGITSEYRKRDNGDEYYINFFTEQAQKFVYDHIREIIAYRNEHYSDTEHIMPSVEYPSDLSVREYIHSNPDKCFIMSVGSYDSVSRSGSYIAVLLFKGKSKTLKKTNISASSAKKCILTGMFDAASAIKLPIDVIILTSTSLGFNSPKSKNYNFCQEIYRILAEKNCNAAFSVCHSKRHELNSFVRSFG